jgi:hypothetical protein
MSHPFGVPENMILFRHQGALRDPGLRGGTASRLKQLHRTPTAFNYPPGVNLTARTLIAFQRHSGAG